MQTTVKVRDSEQQQKELLQGAGRAGEVEGGGGAGGEAGADDEAEQHQAQAGAAD